MLNLINNFNLQEEKTDIIMMTKSKTVNRVIIPQMIKLGYKQRRQLIVTMAIFSLFVGQLCLLVHCQDFEDLNQQHTNKPLQHTFQPLSRQSQLLTQPTSTITTSTTTRQRPLLSNRFAQTSSSSTSGNNLAAQASSSAAVFSLPQQQQQQQAAAPTVVSGSTSIEQLMKNALARTTKLNSEAAAEPRQDVTATSANEAAPQTVPIVGLRSSSGAGVQQQQARSFGGDKQADASEPASDTKPPSGSNLSTIESDSGASDDGDKSTTLAQTTSGHETVYSEQRFANLFARRNNFKKSKIQPTEQIKAKPTLPSFIKSLPDPKQFSANQQLQQESSINLNSNNNNNNNNVRSVTASTSFASQRVTNQARINLANQQATQKNKAIITSNSAASANQKRANSLASSATARPANSASKSSSLSSASSNLKPVANAKPASTPSNNNPFNRQQNNNDPANVIAMARKRLLANNALESAKLKQQQQQQNKAT